MTSSRGSHSLYEHTGLFNSSVRDTSLSKLPKKLSDVKLLALVSNLSNVLLTSLELARENCKTRNSSLVCVSQRWWRYNMHIERATTYKWYRNLCGNLHLYHLNIYLYCNYIFCTFTEIHYLNINYPDLLTYWPRNSSRRASVDPSILVNLIRESWVQTPPGKFSLPCGDSQMSFKRVITLYYPGSFGVSTVLPTSETQTKLLFLLHFWYALRFLGDNWSIWAQLFLRVKFYTRRHTTPNLTALIPR